MNYENIINRLVDLGLSPIPVAPYQNPNFKGHKFYKYLHQSKKVTDSWDNSAKYEPILEADGSFKAKFTGKNPSFLSVSGFPKTIEHKNYQRTLPTQQDFEEWFANLLNGIGSLGNERYRWLDLDRKHFATQGDCDLALLQICPNAQEGWLEQTQSGGYRLLVDCGELGADFTNFALTNSSDHVGELLGSGRYAVMAPTVGVNGAYTNINYGAPIPLAEINIFTAAKQSLALAQLLSSTCPTLPNIGQNMVNSGNSQHNLGEFREFLGKVTGIPQKSDGNSGIRIELFNCITPATQSILAGNPESSDRSADLTKAAKELYGWENWLNSNSISFNGSADILINDCGDALGIDGDRIDRIKKTIDAVSCLPACVIRGGDESAIAHVKKLQYALSPSATQDLRYKAPVKADDLSDINLLDLLPKKYIEAVKFGCDKPSALLPIIKGLAVATEQYLVGKKIKFCNNSKQIFDQFCQSQEPPIVANFETIPSDCEEIDIPTIKKTLAAYDLAQKKIKERIEREALRAAREIEKAKIKASELCELAQNIKTIKQFYSDRFRLNLLTKEVELDGAIFDIDTARICFAEEINITITKNDAIDAIAVIAESNKYHPVYDYLEDCHERLGDDISILEGLAARCFGVDNPLYEAFLKKTLIAAVARVYYPLTKFEKLIPKVAKVDHVFCLVSTQGAKKSTFFEALTSEAFFTDNLDKDLAHKDNIMRLHRKWICEIGEIDRVTNSRYEGDLKNFITIKTDIQRFAYLRAQKVCPRQFLFVGTSNRDDFLTDPTGDRRYWILRTNKKINSDFAKENRDAIWAAAVSLYKSGAEWWLSDVEQEASNDNNRRYQSDSPWMPQVVAFCEYRDKVSTTELLYHIEPQKGKHTHAMQKDVLNCLIRLGYSKNNQRHKALIDGATLRVYSWVLSDNPSASQPQDIDSEPLAETSVKSPNPSANHPSNVGSVSDTATMILSNLSYTHNTHTGNTYTHNDDQNTGIVNPLTSNTPILARQLTHSTHDVDTASTSGVVSACLDDTYQATPLTTSDTVIIAIDDKEVAEIVATQCQVTLWTTEYTIDKIETRYGSKMAYISNGQPVEQPIDVDLLRKVIKNA
jgi:predicted P-loop ATPase